MLRESGSLETYGGGAVLVGLGAWIAAGFWEDFGLLSLWFSFTGLLVGVISVLGLVSFLVNCGLVGKVSTVVVWIACTGLVADIVAQEGGSLILSGGAILAMGAVTTACLVHWLVFTGAFLLSLFRPG